MALAVYRCSACGATGTGDAGNFFAIEEADHAAAGCNGSLRFVRTWEAEAAAGRPEALPTPIPPALPPIKARLVLG
jgi:hypothetical protein